MFGRKHATEVLADVDLVVPEKTLASYDVIYRGGLRNLPKAKTGKIKMEIFADRFDLLPTTGSKRFWDKLTIPFAVVASVDVVERTLNSFEGIAGGLNSRQLNQKNNIHISYGVDEAQTLLRLEMLSGVTVMGQAQKCLEMEDRIRVLGLRDQFLSAEPIVGSAGLSDELRKLASLRDSNILNEDEFAAAKARLLGGF